MNRNLSKIKFSVWVVCFLSTFLILYGSVYAESIELIKFDKSWPSADSTHQVIDWEIMGATANQSWNSEHFYSGAQAPGWEWGGYHPMPTWYNYFYTYVGFHTTQGLFLDEINVFGLQNDVTGGNTNSPYHDLRFDVYISSSDNSFTPQAWTTVDRRYGPDNTDEISYMNMQHSWDWYTADLNNHYVDPGTYYIVFVADEQLNYHSTQFFADQLILTGTPIPEPTTILLFGTGLLGLAGARRRVRK